MEVVEDSEVKKRVEGRNQYMETTPARVAPWEERSRHHCHSKCGGEEEEEGRRGVPVRIRSWQDAKAISIAVTRGSRCEGSAEGKRMNEG